MHRRDPHVDLFGAACRRRPAQPDPADRTLDFSNKPGMTFARWVDERYFDIDKVLGAFGNMPGEMIDYGAKALKPVENYISNYREAVGQPG